MDLQCEMRSEPRAGLRDIWNSRLYEGSTWSPLDNPKVRTTAIDPPTAIISWPDAKRVHKSHLKAGARDYRAHATIHCFIDDFKFDGPREGIWNRWEFFYDVAAHFDGIIGVDFSTHVDFPEPLLRYQFHRMRVVEHGAIQRNIPVIVNARWGGPRTWTFCFDGIPNGQMLAIGTVGSGLRHIENRRLFEAGLNELVRQKDPKALVVVGGVKLRAFDKLRKNGIPIYGYESSTNSRLKKLEEAHV